MLLRIFTHSLKNSISDGAVCLYGWLACYVTELRSTIHPNNENAHLASGPKPAPTGEQGTGTLCPREQTSENTCDAVLSEYESMHP